MTHTAQTWGDILEESRQLIEITDQYLNGQKKRGEKPSSNFNTKIVRR